MKKTPLIISLLPIRLIVKMKKIILFSLLSNLFIAPVIFSKQITEQSFSGTWCGKWDNIYATCIIINNLNNKAVAKYKWLEHPNGQFKRKEKDIIRQNLNTLKIENIWFILDEKNLQQAKVIGIFKSRTRQAVLQKE